MEQAITEQWVAQHIPRRARNAHKGTYGTLTILAGCSSYRGAAALATAAALRAGAGIVRLASTEKVCAAVAASCNCCILSALPETEDGGINPAALPGVLAGKTTAILAGCGLGSTAGTATLVEELLARTTCPLLLDADALNVCAGHFTGEGRPAAREKLLALMKNQSRPLVLTPHIGEMARLCGLAPAEVQQRQTHTALAFAQQYQCVVVLKSHQTVVATPGGDTFYTAGDGNPGLAKGGSGDILAGIIAALLTQGFAPATAAAAGVWLHAAAAATAAGQYGEIGLSPADLPLALAAVWQRLHR